MTVTGGMTFIISNRSGRDRHFDARTAVIQNGWYFLKVTVTRCGLIKVMGMTRVTVTAVDLSHSGYLPESDVSGAKFHVVLSMAKTSLKRADFRPLTHFGIPATARCQSQSHL